MNSNEIKFINELIDKKLEKNVPSILIKKAVRKNTTEIYLNNIKLNKTYHTIAPCINESGEGTLIILNNSLYLYIEHQIYFSELQETLNKLSSLMQQLQTNIGTVPSGGGVVVIDPTLIQQCNEVSNSIQNLLIKIP